MIEEKPELYYIGESSDPIRRQYEHYTMNRNGRMAIFSQSGKTDSMNSETLLIRAAVQTGFKLSSTQDGYHRIKCINSSQNEKIRM